MLNNDTLLTSCRKKLITANIIVYSLELILPVLEEDSNHFGKFRPNSELAFLKILNLSIMHVSERFIDACFANCKDFSEILYAVILYDDKKISNI